VGPVPDPLLFFGSAGNRTRASGSVAKNSEYPTHRRKGNGDRDMEVLELNYNTRFLCATLS
jgi:hypothetical protein